MKAEHKPLSTHIGNSRGVTSLVDFLPEVIDLNIDHVAFKLELIMPDILEQHLACYQLIGMTKEIFEEPEFGRKQTNSDADLEGRSIYQINSKISHRQSRGSNVAKTTDQWHHSCEEFNHVKRLFKIVVGASRQAANDFCRR